MGLRLGRRDRAGAADVASGSESGLDLDQPSLPPSLHPCPPTTASSPGSQPGPSSEQAGKSLRQGWLPKTVQLGPVLPPLKAQQVGKPLCSQGIGPQPLREPHVTQTRITQEARISLSPAARIQGEQVTLQKQMRGQAARAWNTQAQSPSTHQATSPRKSLCTEAPRPIWQAQELPTFPHISFGKSPHQFPITVPQCLPQLGLCPPW